MTATLLMLSGTLIAAASDMRRRTIPNWLTYSGILAALSLNAVGSWWESRFETAGSWQAAIGWIGLEESLLGFFACGFIMLVCFVFFGVGGGDVKLLAMLGAFLGLHQGVEVLLWTFVFGGLLGTAWLARQVGATSLVVRAWRQVWLTIRLGAFSPLPEDDRRLLRAELFLAPCAAAAVIFVRFSTFQLL